MIINKTESTENQHLDESGVNQIRFGNSGLNKERSDASKAMRCVRTSGRFLLVNQNMKKPVSLSSSVFCILCL